MGRPPLPEERFSLYMSLPERTTFLIVGAGPSGLACALSLSKQGCKDILVVDAVEQGENTSRAIVIHAATLEVFLSLLNHTRSPTSDQGSEYHQLC